MRKSNAGEKRHFWLLCSAQAKTLKRLLGVQRCRAMSSVISVHGPAQRRASAQEGLWSMTLFQQERWENMMFPHPPLEHLHRDRWVVEGSPLLIIQPTLSVLRLLVINESGLSSLSPVPALFKPTAVTVRVESCYIPTVKVLFLKKNPGKAHFVPDPSLKGY